MAGRKKQPLSVIQGKGRSNHLTKQDIKERQENEDQMKGFTDKIEAPAYLTKKQKEEFDHYAEELLRLDIFSNLDVDGLARYIDSKSEYTKVVRSLRSMKTTERVTDEDGNTLTISNESYSKLSRTKNLLFNECKAAASDLGLSITSRLKLVIPKAEEKKNLTEAERRFGDRL